MCIKHQILIKSNPISFLKINSVGKILCKLLRIYHFLHSSAFPVYIQDLFDSSDEDDNNTSYEDEEPQKRAKNHGINQQRMQTM